MSALEKFYLRGAVAVAAIYLVFVITVTEGGVPADLTRNTLLTALLAYGLGLALVLGLLWAVAMRSDGDRVRADERERLIEAKADRAGYHILDVALFCLTLVVVLEMGDGEAIGPWRLDRSETMVFALVSLSAFAGLSRFAVGFYTARRG